MPLVESNMVITPPEYIEELKSQPEPLLSSSHAVADVSFKKGADVDVVWKVSTYSTSWVRILRSTYRYLGKLSGLSRVVT
jgi:hypothetical protein